MSLLGAGLSLLGGILGRNAEKAAIARQNAYNDPAAIRERYEAAGFNPLLGIAPGVDLQTSVGGGNFLGSALADAGLQIGDAMQRRAGQIQHLERMAGENDRLRRENASLRLAPPQPGVYGRGGPSVRAGAAPGGANASAENSGLVAPAVRGPAGSGGVPGGVSAQSTAMPRGAPGPAGSDKGTLAPTQPLSVGWLQIFPSGGNSDADVAETRYGDLGGSFIGAGQFIYDAGWNVGRVVKNMSLSPRYRQRSPDGVDYGSPEQRRLREELELERDIAFNLGNRKYDTWGPGARRQDF